MRTPICHIVGGGENSTSFLHREEGDFLIACDSGLSYLEEKNLSPDLIVGDFDSYTGDFLKFGDVEKITLPEEKDDTDLLFALKVGLKRSYKNFMIYGGLGGSRISHSLANIALLSFLEKEGAHGVLISENALVTLFSKSVNLKKQPSPKGYISFFPYGGDAKVTLEGFKYPFDGILTREFPLGCSNEQTADTGKIEIHSGLLLAVAEGEILSPSLLFYSE